MGTQVTARTWTEKHGRCWRVGWISTVHITVSMHRTMWETWTYETEHETTSTFSDGGGGWWLLRDLQQNGDSREVLVIDVADVQCLHGVSALWPPFECGRGARSPDEAGKAGWVAGQKLRPAGSNRRGNSKDGAVLSRYGYPVIIHP